MIRRTAVVSERALRDCAPYSAGHSYTERPGAPTGQRALSDPAPGRLQVPWQLPRRLHVTWPGLRFLPGLIHDEVEHRPPLENLAELRAIEQVILQGIEELEGILR